MILDSQYRQDTIKKKVAEWDPRFSLEDMPGAHFKVLYYGPGGSERIKIDVLIEGCAELPFLNAHDINYQYGPRGSRLPVAPLWLVLLHKVLGWRKHLRAPKYPQYMKHWRDASDVANLLSIAWETRETLEHLPNEFNKSARTWVNEFIAAYPRPEISYQWRSTIGFEQGPTNCIALVTYSMTQDGQPCRKNYRVPDQATDSLGFIPSGYQLKTYATPQCVPHLYRVL